MIPAGRFGTTETVIDELTQVLKGVFPCDISPDAVAIIPSKKRPILISGGVTVCSVINHPVHGEFDCYPERGGRSYVHTGNVRKITNLHSTSPELSGFLMSSGSTPYFWRALMKRIGCAPIPSLLARICNRGGMAVGMDIGLEILGYITPRSIIELIIWLKYIGEIGANGPVYNWILRCCNDDIYSIQTDLNTRPLPLEWLGRFHRPEDCAICHMASMKPSLRQKTRSKLSVDPVPKAVNADLKHELFEVLKHIGLIGVNRDHIPASCDHVPASYLRVVHYSTYLPDIPDPTEGDAIFEEIKYRYVNRAINLTKLVSSFGDNSDNIDWDDVESLAVEALATPSWRPRFGGPNFMDVYERMMYVITDSGNRRCRRISSRHCNSRMINRFTCRRPDGASIINHCNYGLIFRLLGDSHISDAEASCFTELIEAIMRGDLTAIGDLRFIDSVRFASRAWEDRGFASSYRWEFRRLRTMGFELWNEDLLVDIDEGPSGFDPDISLCTGRGMLQWARTPNYFYLAECFLDQHVLFMEALLKSPTLINAFLMRGVDVVGPWIDECFRFASERSENDCDYVKADDCDALLPLFYNLGVPRYSDSYVLFNGVSIFAGGAVPVEQHFHDWDSAPNRIIRRPSIDPDAEPRYPHKFQISYILLQTHDLVRKSEMPVGIGNVGSELRETMDEMVLLRSEKPKEADFSDWF